GARVGLAAVLDLAVRGPRSPRGAGAVASGDRGAVPAPAAARALLPGLHRRLLRAGRSAAPARLAHVARAGARGAAPPRGGRAPAAVRLLSAAREPQRRAHDDGVPRPRGHRGPERSGARRVLLPAGGGG